MKKLLTVLLSCLMVFMLFPISVIKAEITKDDKIVHKEELNSEDEKYIIIYYEDRTDVTVKNNNDEIISKAIYYNETNKLVLDGETYFVRKTSTRGRVGYYKYDFDINPHSVASAVAAVIAMSPIAAAIYTAGVSLSTFKAALAKAFHVASVGWTLKQMAPNLSLNGYFTFGQEVEDCKSRNIDRMIKVRAGYNRDYTTEYLGDGDWFETCKPY